MNVDQLKVKIKPGQQNKIIFAAVDKRYDKHTIDGGIDFFPNDEQLRTFRLGKTNVVYLNELPEKNCKHCYGTGEVGKRIVSPNEKVLKEVLQLNWDNKDLAKEIIEGIGYPYDLVEPLELLLKMAREELTKDNHEELAEIYAKMIKKDFEFKEVIWCQCFIQNLQKAVDEAVRNQKFAIN